MSEVYHKLTSKGNYIQLFEGNGTFVIKRNDREVANSNIPGLAHQAYHKEIAADEAKY